MRYRRISYTYTRAVAPGEPGQLGGPGFREGRGVRLARTAWKPPADLYETPQRVFVTLELAGVDADTLDVLLYEDALVVEGERSFLPPEPGGVYYSAEIRQGRFRLELPLNCRVDADSVTADYEKGLLRITLSRAKGR